MIHNIRQGLKKEFLPWFELGNLVNVPWTVQYFDPDQIILAQILWSEDWNELMSVLSFHFKY